MFGEHSKKDKRVVQPSTFKLTNISIAGRVQLASTTATHVYLNPTTGPMKSIATRDQDSNRLPSTVEFSRAKEKSKESIGN
ncbi:hypothetical protein HanRHA438_Chr01g0029181 [Helianthus annuus]|uniref:Uncharacterized protein n=1 Tax=Helianthus annuus TaxID=4232 RepID=A0A9K3JX18_HELAN|nr:hypothetical protein HanXRQr2_Chr01g0028661 [Helianthus annuus]KAJ0612069.1 hypothetical protein HanHA300_Chr01g0023011 [Helianthus annuus]KAJ0627427.1 hypothetical protein HanHA89_Chr01g0025251 [Helianthus annuus]KAJ0783735.1 hypothetical protein HanLR1_Chr01g0023811 [Helianthus annuus]KAJ0948608.1 hypothetical protein HanRHA438_Chr01g0029181 [Helianthus annuus]